MTEEASDAIVGVIQATGNASVMVREWVFDVLGASRSLTHEVWSGIELRNVSMSAYSGYASTESPELLAVWLRTPEAMRLMKNCDDVVTAAQDMTASLQMGIPFLGVERRIFNTSSVFAAIKLMASMSPRGDVNLVWNLHEANFTVAWSNPAWSWLEMPVSLDHPGATALVDAHFRQIPRAEPAEPQVITISASWDKLLVWKSNRLRRLWKAFWTWQSTPAPWYGGQGQNSADATDSLPKAA